MPIDTRMPDWMVDKGPFNNSVSHDLQTGFQLGQRNRQLEQQQRESEALQQFRASQLRSQEAYRQTAINTQLMRQQQIEAEQTDAALVTKWMQDPRQPPPTGLRTPKGLSAVKQVQDIYANTEVGNARSAAQKGYADQIKGLDAMGILRVTTAMDEANGAITPQVATLIDTEVARMQATTADLQVIDEMGQLYLKGGENKPAYIRSVNSPSLHRLPQDWSAETNPVVPLKDDDGNVLGYGVRNASGGITQLRQEKSATTTLPPEKRAAMNLEFKTVQSWWDGLDKREKAKPENQALLRQKISEVEGKYTMQPAPAVPNDFQQKYDAIPSGITYTAPDGSIRTKR